MTKSEFIYSLHISPELSGIIHSPGVSTQQLQQPMQCFISISLNLKAITVCLFDLSISVSVSM